MQTAVFVACILAAYAPAAQADDMTRRYRAALDTCAGENVAKLDDGVTQANVVANALFVICRRQNHALYSAISAANSTAWMVGYERAAVAQFTTYVLLHRTTKVRGPKP